MKQWLENKLKFIEDRGARGFTGNYPAGSFMNEH